jgi:hypothetical protein
MFTQGFRKSTFFFLEEERFNEYVYLIFQEFHILIVALIRFIKQIVPGLRMNVSNKT